MPESSELHEQSKSSWIGNIKSSLLQSTDSERICFSCSGMRQDEKCQHAITCDKDEICFVQKYFTHGNETKYDVGCTFQELCKKDVTGHILGKRNEHAHIVCQKCCNDSNVCNYDLSCQNTITIPGQNCLSCDNVDNPKSCNSSMTCAKEEVCFIHKYLTETQHVKYDLGCKHSTLCLHGSNTNIFGRRSSAGRHLTCEKCCGGTEICNVDLQCGHQEQKTINASCSSTNECGSNLVCSTGRCQCFSIKYYWDNIACIKKKSNSEVCTENRQCSDMFQCTQNMCSCPGNQYWNRTACIQRKSINLTCNASSECLESLICIHGECKCDQAFEYWTGSACTQRNGFNSTCTSSEECETHFRCHDKKCVCAAISEYWSGYHCLKGRECVDLEITTDGVYTIYPNGNNQPVQVFCTVRQSEKWTVIQRRVNGSVDFYRTWNEYKHGFGTANGEYWLGNDNIHRITTNGHHEISIYMGISGGEHHTANYTTFRVSDEQSLYVLTVTGFSGEAGQNAMDYPTDNYKANGKPFTTKDKDNDKYSGNRANDYKSAWWYSNDSYSDLNTAYSGSSGTMYWGLWSGVISKSIMMIKRTY
ncbi:Hypothetical predicted protein [Mytilus galloprovincialis]|uniref:Fibrinogen C-terminal domain-containing protein n=1 Tax=Mytilus galloprovincialis TaxID=29158 RepID=A0A8B6CCZ3_MYTGA|nr:Hypothetical predicted protein [Mytilus galloprovincialis]